jgi:hypothetical protein
MPSSPPDREPPAPYVPGATLKAHARDAALTRALHGGLDGARFAHVASRLASGWATRADAPERPA